MGVQMSKKKVWYISHPLDQYAEDVATIKALARNANLRIIDANVTDYRGDAEDNPPALTLKINAESEKVEPEKAEKAKK